MYSHIAIKRFHGAEQQKPLMLGKLSEYYVIASIYLHMRLDNNVHIYASVGGATGGIL